MNKEWSDLNKAIQVQLRKESTFSDGIDTLLNWIMHVEASLRIKNKIYPR